MEPANREARWLPCRLDARPAEDAADRLEHHRRFWGQSFDRLDDYLGDLRQKEKDMDARTGIDVESAQRELVITRIFDAPRPLVFQAWTEPDRVARWWGPQGFTTLYCDMDVRPGGAFRVCMRSPEGAEHWKQGVYREVVEPERLVFTFAWEDAEGRPGHETVVTVTFAELAGKTKLTLHQGVFETVAASDEHQRGWTSTLQRFAEYLTRT
jgi:uncharacterized protein YndB with AHSA1/START domain